MKRYMVILMAFFLTIYAKEEETNEVTPLEPPINLDANLRRALLKALTELENEENEKANQELQIHDLPQIDTKDKIIEKASASALSFFADSQEKTTKTSVSSTTEKTTETPSFIIQHSKGVQHNPITTDTNNYNLGTITETEQILTSASSSFASSNNFFDKTKTKNGPNFVTKIPNSFINDNTITTNSKPVKAEVTTVPTVTTSTEENEAKVEDVQFFSAPLVAAFTVHQDERGLPKSVVPLLKPAQKTENKIKPTTAAQPLVQTLPSHQFQQHQQLQQPQQQQYQNHHQQQNLNVQLSLQQKQKALEEEIARLKQQQLQQNYLIRQQQILHGQQLLLQRQKLEEQLRNVNNQRPFVPIPNQFNESNQRNQFNNIANNNQNQSRVKGTLLSFQPSIGLSSNHQTSTLPLNAQELPIKNPINFHSPFTHQPQFNFAQQQLPAANVANFNNFNALPQNPLKHNRVFRQETGTGNFFNNNFNAHFNQVPFQQQQQQQHQQPNRFFRSNQESFNRIQPPVVNHHLNNLLYNSGLYRDKQIEDLNIVSKVLSLNHYGGDYRFSGSNINEQRVPFVKRV